MNVQTLYRWRDDRLDEIEITRHDAEVEVFTLVSGVSEVHHRGFPSATEAEAYAQSKALSYADEGFSDQPPTLPGPRVGSRVSRLRDHPVVAHAQAHPDRTDVREVLADYLLDAGHPYGYFVAQSLQDHADDDHTWWLRCLTVHSALLSDVGFERVGAAYRRGFLRELGARLSRSDLGDLLDQPAAWLLEALSLNSRDLRDAAPRSLPTLPTVRKLVLSTGHLPDLAEFVRAFPNVEAFGLHLAYDPLEVDILFACARWPRLTALSLAGSRAPETFEPALLEMLVRGDAPLSRLRSLHIPWCRTPAWIEACDARGLAAENVHVEATDGLVSWDGGPLWHVDEQCKVSELDVWETGEHGESSSSGLGPQRTWEEDHESFVEDIGDNDAPAPMLVMGDRPEWFDDDEPEPEPVDDDFDGWH